MIKKNIFEIKSLYRDDYRVMSYEFGTGEHSVCIVGNTRGNEIQQIYICSQLVKRLKELEENDRIIAGKKITVIPSLNPCSMNIDKRFWPTDNSDINRMFPGYELGETTQRIAAKVFEQINDYQYGIQFTSFYMPGDFIPHVRMMKTGFENVELAKKFGMPYIILRKPRPYDTTTLNYNWQIWGTNAFSLYTNTTERIDVHSAERGIRSILTFMAKQGIIRYSGHDGYISRIVDDTDMISVRTGHSGIFDSKVEVNQEVREGQLLAEIIDPYDAGIKDRVYAPVDGAVFFLHNKPLTYANTAVIKLIKGGRL